MRNPFIQGALSGLGLGILYAYTILVNLASPIARAELISAKYYFPIVFFAFALFGLATAEVIIDEQKERSA